jgi:hypothetical protein
LKHPLVVSGSSRVEAVKKARDIKFMRSIQSKGGVEAKLNKILCELPPHLDKRRAGLGGSKPGFHSHTIILLIINFFI